MESPVRICLGAALVVNLLLLSSTPANGNALPHEPTPTIKDERTPRHTRNTTWVKHRTPDEASNELNPKSSLSEENTDKNAKYKDRGRIRFGASIKSSTDSPYRRTRTKSSSTTQATVDESTLIIVTPTPEVKKPAQIINSMRNYKKTKMPVVVSSTPSLPVSVKNEVKSNSDEEYDDEDDNDHKESFEELTSSKFDTNFFTIPNYGEDHDFSHDSEGADNKLKSEFSKKPYDTFSSYFPEINFSKDDQHDEPFKTDSFFNFDTELTTPKHDFFDKKYEQISQSIIKNLAAMKTKAQPTNATILKLEKERADREKLGELTDSEMMSKPGNKSTVFIKNTKEIRLLDNEGAGTTNQALSDNVQGTSIYYEKMSVLSTETYNVSHSDEDDCDNDALPAEPTVSTSSEQELASFKATQPTLDATKSYEPTNEYVSTSYSNYLPFSSLDPTYFSSVSPQPYPTQNSLSPTDKIKVYTSSFTRNRNYSKRLNLTGANDSPNSVTRTVPPTFVSNYRPSTRKFHFTTPKTKPIWMAPRRNVTRTSYTRSTPPTTIYSEHFSIKNRTTSAKPLQPHRTSLTTVSSEIDPIIEGDIDNVKKIVHSASVSDNSIPTLWKRGSTKFTASTVASSEADSGVSELEIPPTSAVWALASLRSSPSMDSPVANGSVTTKKKIYENELQKVGEVADKKESTTSETITTANTINIDSIPKKLTEINQNKLPWKPVLVPTTPTLEVTSIELKSESLPAESNINIQSSIKPVYSTEKSAESTEISNTASTDDQRWVSVADIESTTTKEINHVEEKIPPVDATKSTGFESITKLPAGMTTPQDEFIARPSTDSINESVPATTDYDITTIRFSYQPTEAEKETETQKIPASTWHPVFPTRTRVTTDKETTVRATTIKETTVKDEPVTTYRPIYKTTTDIDEEPLRTSTETTVMLEVSSERQNVQELVNETTESVKVIATDKFTTKPTRLSTEIVPEDTTTMAAETPTMIVNIVTEINTEREKPTARTEVSTNAEVSSSSEMTETPSSEMGADSSSEQNSGSNEVITQEPKTSSPSVTSRAAEVPTESEQVPLETTTLSIESTSQSAKFTETTNSTDESTTDGSNVNEDDSSTANGDVTTEAIILTEEAGSGAAIAIAVSTIGVIALIMLVGLLLVVRRRGRQGVYAQRCTPVSLDAYSLDSVSVGHRKGNHRLRASKRSYGNPAYDDEVTSHPMQYAALANFAHDIESMTTEFAEIPSVTVRPDEVPPGCEDKNRYSNVLPLPETRVSLSRIGNDPTSEYINANYITGPGNIKNYYIACQAPLPNTVDDFWRMIWEQNSRVIVMLTEYMENGVEKCYEYLPPSEVSDNKRTFGDYQIILTKREQHDKYAVSTVQLGNLNTRTWREITHLWYFWPAKGVPDDYESVIDFLAEMRGYMKNSQTAKEYDEEGIEVIYGDATSSLHNLSKLRSEDSSSGNGVNVYSPSRAEEQLKRTNGTLGRIRTADVEGVRPCVVTCASGAGRSAAFIAADICARALSASAADVPRVVRELRAQRPHSLSNRHHYIFIYKLLAEYGNKLMGGVDTI